MTQWTESPPGLWVTRRGALWLLVPAIVTTAPTGGWGPSGVLLHGSARRWGQGQRGAPVTHPDDAAGGSRVLCRRQRVRTERLEAGLPVTTAGPREVRALVLCSPQRHPSATHDTHRRAETLAHAAFPAMSPVC